MLIKYVPFAHTEIKDLKLPLFIRILGIPLFGKFMGRNEIFPKNSFNIVMMPTRKLGLWFSHISRLMAFSST